MTRAARLRHRLTGPRASLALSLPALAVSFAAFAIAPHDRLFEPLTGLLAACSVVATLAYIDLNDRIDIDASFVPSMLAIGFLGPGPAFAVVVLGELMSWSIRRYRPVVVPINIVSLGLPVLVFGTLFTATHPTHAWFYVGLGLVGLAGLQFNDVLLTSLMGLLDNKPIASALRDHLRLLPVVGLNVVLALAAASLYTTTGLSAIVVVFLAIVAFNYMTGEVLKAERRAHEIADLAASRQRLVIQALDAEERERRRLAEQLHDGAIQDLLVARQDVADTERQVPGAAVRLGSAIDRVLEQLRGAIFNLHPTILERAGLEPAVEAVATQQSRLGGFSTAVDVDPDATGIRDRLLFTISRELLTNVAKHAGAERVDVKIVRVSDRIELDVRDDGRGFSDRTSSAAVRAGHIGLASVVERVKAVGGYVEFRNPASGGAHVQVVLPTGHHGLPAYEGS